MSPFIALLVMFAAWLLLMWLAYKYKRPTHVVGVGVAVLVRKNGKILLGKRKGPRGVGTWGFPGGLVEPNEAPLEAAQRELFEETGLDPTNVYPHRRLPYATSVISGQTFVTIHFVVDVSAEPRLMEPDKHECWQWFDPKNPPTPLFAPLVGKLDQLVARHQK